MPLAFSALANWQTSCQQLLVGDPRDLAVVGLEDDRDLVALPSLEVRSRQLYEALSSPSSNHLKNGAFDSSSVLVNGLGERLGLQHSSLRAPEAACPEAPT
jgi:hypothetical protein